MKVVVLEPLGVEKTQFLSMAQETLGDGIELVCYDSRVEDVPTLIERSCDADIVVLSNFQYREEVISQCPKLKMICVAFTGYDHVDMEYCSSRGIAVCNCAGYSTQAVADLVFGMVLALERRILACDVAARSGGTKAGLVGFELSGKTFGIVGTGAIGLQVATIALAFGCRVLAYSRTQKEIAGITYVDFKTLLSQSDIVSLHVPATPETHHMLDTEQFQWMKSSAILINCARGSVVNSQALADALAAGQLAGAGIDVLEHEPPFSQEHPLVTAPNTLLTPHVAFATAQSMVKRSAIVFENIKQYIEGTPQNVVS